MALVRILVDGYSLIHNWPGLATACAPHSAAAREALIQKLTHYHDAVGTPITVFFDGSDAPAGVSDAVSSLGVEILFSRNGQSADQMIERAAYRFQPYGEVLAVTDDIAERETVVGMGGMAQNCLNFIHHVESALLDMTLDIRNHNRSEKKRYQDRTET